MEFINPFLQDVPNDSQVRIIHELSVDLIKRLLNEIPSSEKRDDFVKDANIVLHEAWCAGLREFSNGFILEDNGKLDIRY